MISPNQVRRLLATNGVMIAAVLLLVGLVAIGGAIAVYTSPPTETVTEQRNSETISVGTNTSAIVAEETALYEEGERLENLPVYFLSSTPHLDFSVSTIVPDDTEVTVTQRLYVYMEASRDGQQFWTERRVLAANEERVRDGQADLSTGVNMSALWLDAAERRRSIATVGTFSSQVRLNVSYDTGQYSGEITASAPLVFAENAYWLGSELQTSRTHSETIRREVQQQPNMQLVGGLSVFGVVALFGAGAVIWYRRNGPELGSIHTDAVHDQYEEWISKGEFPTGTDKKFVFIETLKDLVDIAIDSNKRVVFDPELSTYAVIDGDLVYYYSKDRSRIESWLDI